MSNVKSNLKSLLPFVKYMNPLIVSMKYKAETNEIVIDKLLTLISFVLHVLLLLLCTYFAIEGYYSDSDGLVSERFSNDLYVAFIICTSYGQIFFAVQYNNLISLWNQILNVMNEYKGFSSYFISQKILIVYIFISKILDFFLLLIIFKGDGISLEYFTLPCFVYFVNNNQAQVSLLQYFTLVNMYKNQFKNIYSNIELSFYNNDSERLLMDLNNGAVAHQHLCELMNLTVKVSSLHLMAFLIDASFTLSAPLYYLLRNIIQGSVMEANIWYMLFLSIDRLICVIIIIKTSESCIHEVSSYKKSVIVKAFIACIAEELTLKVFLLVHKARVFTPDRELYTPEVSPNNSALLTQSYSLVLLQMHDE